MTSSDMTGTFLFETRRDLTAEIGRQRTPPGKDAALDPRLEARHLPGDFGEAPRGASERGAKLGHRAEQALRVGMTGRAEQLGHRRLLNLAAAIHHHDPPGDFRADAEVIADPDDPRPTP